MEFMFDEENGLIIDRANGERFIIMPSAHPENVFLQLFEIFQSGAKVITSEAFQAVAKWYINEIPEVTETDLPACMAQANQRCNEGGFGKVEIVRFNPEQGELNLGL